MKFGTIAVATLVLGSLSAAANAVVYNFVDTTFVNSDWVGVKYADTSTPTGSFTAAQVTSGGSALLPGPQTPNYREISHTFGGVGAGAIIVSHQNVNFNWAPAPLETATMVDYSYDLQFFSTINFGAVGFSPAIFQGSDVYRLPGYDNVFSPTTGWIRFPGSGIPLGSFVRIDPATASVLPGAPNGSVAMGFGFVSANSANQSSVLKISGLDDYRFTLNTVVAPEPTTLACIASVALMFRRRRSI